MQRPENSKRRGAEGRQPQQAPTRRPGGRLAWQPVRRPAMYAPPEINEIRSLAARAAAATPPPPTRRGRGQVHQKNLSLCVPVPGAPALSRPGRAPLLLVGGGNRDQGACGQWQWQRQRQHEQWSPESSARAARRRHGCLLRGTSRRRRWRYSSSGRYYTAPGSVMVWYCSMVLQYGYCNMVLHPPAEVSMGAYCSASTIEAPPSRSTASAVAICRGRRGHRGEWGGRARRASDVPERAVASSGQLAQRPA